MPGRQPDKVDRWLFAATAAVLFRICLVPTGFVASCLDVALRRQPVASVGHLAYAIPVLEPVIAVAFAVLVARLIEPKLPTVGRKKIVTLIVLSIVALLPWQPQVRFKVEAVGCRGVSSARTNTDTMPAPYTESSRAEDYMKASGTNLVLKRLGPVAPLSSEEYRGSWDSEHGGH